MGFEPTAKKPSVFIEHNLTYIDEDNAKYLLEEGRLFTLLPYTYGKQKTKMLNPHYFGEVRTRKVFDSIVNIALLGSSSKDEDNIKLLFQAIRYTSARSKKKFKIHVVGFVIDIPEDLTEHVQVIGRVAFPEYYKIIENCHYIMTLVNLQSKDIIHTKYRTGTTTGTVQTSLGFAVPMIIDSVHAEAYALDKKSSIIYSPNQLSTGLLEAVETGGIEYRKLQTSLKELGRDITKVSLENLNEVLLK